MARAADRPLYSRLEMGERGRKSRVRGTSRERLLESSKRVLYEKGIRATNVDQLAAAAEVSKPTLYANFGSKEELVEAALERRRADRQRQIEEVLAPLPEGEARLDALLELHAGMVPGPRFRGCPLVAAALELPDSAPARASADAFKVWMEERLAREAAIAGYSDSRELAASLLLLIEGAIVLGFLRGGSTTGRSLRHAWRALLHQHAAPVG
jgi:AcrR family transcriptional regulator